MPASLLTSVGFEWEKHPHRLHTMRVDPSIDGGIELRGGPWTTGERSKDSIVSRTAWSDVHDVGADVRHLDPRSAEGPGVAEVRWTLDDTPPHAAIAVTSLSLESTSHPAGFNVAGFGVGVDETESGREAWLRIEAGKVPERPERFESIAVTAGLSVAVLDPGGDGFSIEVERLQSHNRTRGGFRPDHAPLTMPSFAGQVLGIGGWSWSVTNTPKTRGRYLRGFAVAVAGDRASIEVSNQGEVTRPTDLDLEVDVVVRHEDG